MGRLTLNIMFGYAQFELKSFGRARQRGGKLGVAEVAVDHAATVVICGVLASNIVGMSSAIGSVCM